MVPTQIRKILRTGLFGKECFYLLRNIRMAIQQTSNRYTVINSLIQYHVFLDSNNEVILIRYYPSQSWSNSFMAMKDGYSDAKLLSVFSDIIRNYVFDLFKLKKTADKDFWSIENTTIIRKFSQLAEEWVAYNSLPYDLRPYKDVVEHYEPSYTPITVADLHFICSVLKQKSQKFMSRYPQSLVNKWTGTQLNLFETHLEDLNREKLVEVYDKYVNWIGTLQKNIPIVVTPESSDCETSYKITHTRIAIDYLERRRLRNLLKYSNLFK